MMRTVPLLDSTFYNFFIGSPTIPSPYCILIIVLQHYPGLGYWVHAQRNQYRLLKQGKKSPMTHEKALRLADIGFVFDAMKKKGSAGPIAGLEDANNEEEQPQQFQGVNV